MENFISVIITIYDRVEFYREAIESAINQTLNKDYYEIIVVHNIDIDQKLDGVTYIKSNEVGIGPKLLIGLEKAKGNIVSFLEDDDKFLPNKLKFVFDSFADPRVVYVHNNYISNDDNFRNGDIDFNMSCISVRKEIINKNIEKVNFFLADTFIYFMALERGGKIINSELKLTFYRVHANNQSIFKDLNSRMKLKCSVIEEYTKFLNIFENPKVKKLIKVRMTDINIWIILHGGYSKSKVYLILYFIHSLRLSKIRGIVAYILFKHGILRTYIEKKVK